MTFLPVRPYPNQVAELVAGIGPVPITNAACGFLATLSTANSIYQLILKAAINAQGTNNLGIPNPPPDLAMTSGLPDNNLRDLIQGETQIAYYSPDAPQAYVVRGTVIIPNQEAPSGPPTATLTIEQYIGPLALAAKPNSTALKMNPQTGEFSWV